MKNLPFKNSSAEELGREAGRYFGSKAVNQDYKDWHDFAQKRFGFLDANLTTASEKPLNHLDWISSRCNTWKDYIREYENYLNNDVLSQNSSLHDPENSAAKLGREAGKRAGTIAKQNECGEKASDNFAERYWEEWAKQNLSIPGHKDDVLSMLENEDLFKGDSYDSIREMAKDSNKSGVTVQDRYSDTYPTLNIYNDLDAYTTFIENEAKSRALDPDAKPRVNHWNRIESNLPEQHPDVHLVPPRPSDKQIESDIKMLARIMQPGITKQHRSKLHKGALSRGGRRLSRLRRSSNWSKHHPSMLKTLSNGYHTLNYMGKLADDYYFRGATYAGNVLGYFIADMIADLYDLPHTERTYDDLFGAINKNVPIEGRSLQAYLKAIENGENTDDWFAQAIDMDVFNNWQPETEAGRKFKARLAETLDVLSPSELAKGAVLSKVNKAVAKPLGKKIDAKITEESYPRLRKWIKNGFDLVDNTLGAGESVNDACQKTKTNDE